MTDKPTDAVAQARAELEAAMSWLTTDESHRIDALIAAVEARCAADTKRLDALERWMQSGEGKGVDMWRAGRSWSVDLTEHHDATNAHSAREQSLRAALDALAALEAP